MKGTIKDLIKLSGVQGYIVANQKSIQMKLPSMHRFAGSKDRIKQLYEDLVQTKKRPGNIVEIFLDDMVLTIFINGMIMLVVLSSPRVNLALVRMTGKLVIANIVKEMN
jgi:hypothetical protein